MKQPKKLAFWVNAENDYRPLFIVLTFGLLIRLFLTPFLTYHLDFVTYLAWSNTLIEQGLKTFFLDNWVDYLPGYPYVLWLLALISRSLHLVDLTLLYKLPAILADLATGLVIFKLLDPYKKRKFSILNSQFSIRTLAVAVYVFNPAVFANSALWGQTDSFTALFALLTLALSLQKKPLLAGISLGLGSLIKLNTVLIAPVAVIALFSRRQKINQLTKFFLSAVTVFAVGFIPFLNQTNLLAFIAERVSVTTNQYQHTSLNALNFWYLLDGSWKSDQIKLLGLTKHFWGNLAFLAVYGSALVLLLKTKRRELIDYVATAALGFTGAFLLLTRMHERHLLAAFPFLLILAAVNKKWRWYLWFSGAYIFNLLFGYQAGPGNLQLFTIPKLIPKIVSLLNLAFLFYFLKAFFQGKRRILKKPRSLLIKLRQHKILVAILVISFFLRTYRLSVPSEFHFDEVYHAFTAREMLRGNVKAWQWWNTPPEGVAYEWTHPPLAKHFMVVGMQIFGEDSFGWRFPGILFGTANILLVYLLAKELFKNRKPFAIGHMPFTLPLLAAGLYSVESLSFVQSRIGMNDTYMIFFILLSLITLLKQKYSASALSFSLALATKWSAIYIVPVLAIMFLFHKNKRITIKRFFLLAIRYLLFAVIVYLLAYLPFFVSGHTWKQFIQLQQQMYWYHTRLDATHDYSSPWWSWPILLRPVWYHVKYAQNTTANIYALGNPLIFWGGLAALIYALTQLVKNLIQRRSTIYKPLTVLLVGYLAFLLPWALSPRIMFLYHYLPSIPFMVILLAWALTKLYSSGNLGKKTSLLIISCSLLIFMFFFPHLTALPVSRDWVNNFFWFSTWK